MKINWKKIGEIAKNSALLVPKIVSLPVVAPLLYLSMPLLVLVVLVLGAVFGFHYFSPTDVEFKDVLKAYLWPPIYA